MVGLNSTTVFDAYWRFAAERLAMYTRRLSDPDGPWTDDPILQRFRFTNTYRACDRVTQYLLKEVQYRDDRSQSGDEVFFRTLLFKIFNKVETWELLERHLGSLAWSSIDLNEVDKILSDAVSKGSRIYSGAYIMPPPNFGKVRKHSNHLMLLSRMMDDDVPELLSECCSLRDAYQLMLGYPGLGPFLAFQYAIDLNYSTLLDFEERDFVVAGPGALDGISKCFEGPIRMTAEDVIYQVAESQEGHFARLDLEFNGLLGRRLMPIDCQNLFCEISKYSRAAFPDVTGSSGRTRIKQGFTQVRDPLPEPFFPPKWNLASPISTGDHQLSMAGSQQRLF
jgi:alpha-glutamyl/putrescinyl thymine pyrophosphorylase clade 1